MFIPTALTPKNDRALTHVQVMAKLREKFKDIKGVRLTMRDNSARNLSAGRQNPVNVSFRGPDLEVLNEKTQELIKRLEEENLAVDLDSDFRLGLPELVIKPNREAMAERGVAVTTIGETIAATVGGTRQGRYTADGKRYDIRFKFKDADIRSADDIKKIQVRNSAGNILPLSEMVSIVESKASQSISRVNRQRAISVYGNLAPGQSQSQVLKRIEQISKEVLPEGYSFAFEGAAAGFSEAFSSLWDALIIGILVAFLILAIQFNSFIHPVSVLMALPFSVTGALLALWATNTSLNLFSFIGLIVLMGIAKKNSIMLVEFTNQIRERQHARTKKDIELALLDACPVRLRPIIMTSVATVTAAIPLIVGSGMGSEARTPMGLAIIGGTIVSTVLTLFVIPALYLLLAGLERPQKVMTTGTAELDVAETVKRGA
jgi:multidrug efflux pump subunit AcrB